MILWMMSAYNRMTVAALQCESRIIWGLLCEGLNKRDILLRQSDDADDIGLRY